MRLLDSDIATLIYYGRNAAVVDRYESLSSTEHIALALITKAEILRGRLESLLKAATSAEWMTAQTRLKATESWLSGFETIDISEAAAAHFDRLSAQKKFRKLGRADLLVACIALAVDAVLVSRNLKDFQSIPNLKLENWAD